MKKIKNVEELPSWFSIKNYDGCYHLTAFEWWLNLSLRRGYYIDESKNEPVFLTQFNGHEAAVKKLWNNPLISFSKSGKKIESTGSSFSSLTSLQAFQIFEHFNSDPELRSKVTTVDIPDIPLFKRVKIDKTRYPFSPGRRAPYSINHPEQFYTVVNLNAPDTQLINDFKQWLNKVRSEYSFEATRVKKFSRADFASWATNQVLAFLDLTAWANFNNKSISNFAMGQAIIPDDYGDITSRVRNTIKVKALELMDKEMLETLGAQV